MWDEASDWEGSLRPTEKMLYWPARAPYPWIPGADCAMNPLISPLVVTGGWNIPELATHRARQLMIQAASQRAAAMADVDDDEHLPSRDAGVDVDDQPTDGWRNRPTDRWPEGPTDRPTAGATDRRTASPTN